LEGYAIEHKLSPREREVVDLAGKGMTSRDIGQRLGLAEVTVKGVLARLMRRFDCENRVQLISRFSPQPKSDSEPSE
jgi:DNA-binding CsgD family transcriptional regulator